MNLIDPTYQIRKHYIDMLSAVAGMPTVVNYATLDIEPPFVRVNVSASYQGTKCSHSWNATTQMFVVVKAPGDWGGDALTEEISNLILTTIHATTPLYGTTDNFKLVTQVVTVNDVDSQLTPTGRVFLKQLVIESFIDQIN